MKAGSPAVRWVAIMIASLSLSCVALGQNQQKRRASPDPDKLRRDFIAAADGNLELVSDYLSNSPEVWGSLRHWMVFAKPVRTGRYLVKYTFNYPGGEDSHGERSYEFRAAERGCRRSELEYIPAGNLCLGDTIILPIRLEGLLDLKLSVDFTPESIAPKRNVQAWPHDPDQLRPLPGSVENPLADILKFLGTQRHDALKRSGDISVIFSAVFQAVRPGRFNLTVHNDRQPEARTAQPTRDHDWEQAVIVVDLNTPVTFLAETEYTLDYSRRYPSTVGNSNNYQIRTRIVQVGDYLVMPYVSEEHRANFRRPVNVTSESVLPVILRREFTPRTDSYDAWVLPYFPD